MRKILFMFLLLNQVVQAQESMRFKPLGDVKSIKSQSNSWTIAATGGNLRIWFYTPTVVRVTASKEAAFYDFSFATIGKPEPATKVIAKDEPNSLTLSSDSLVCVITKKPLKIKFLNKEGKTINEDDFGIGWQGDEVTSYKKIMPDERFLGLGEKTGPLDRRGNGYTNWNTDYYGYPDNADMIYSTFPFYIGVHSGLTYGIFLDNSYKTHFNFGASNDRFSSFTAEGGDMDYYFIGNRTVGGVIASYSYLTGTTPMPAYWSIGYQQCRYSYYPDKEVLTLAQTFRDKKIPCDAITLDIHYMDKYKLFTWDKERFPDPKGMISKLKSQGFRTITIIDPGVKIEKGYDAYEDGLKNDVFIKYPDGTPYSGQVWPGWCHFPDFTKASARAWWGSKFSGLVSDGVDGFWNDMNEIATWGQRLPDLMDWDFEGRKGTTRNGRNLYGMMMVRASYEGTKKLMNRRPFILCRAGYSGLQRYSALWTGDNQSNDNHMLLGVRLVNSLGLAGVPFAGYDVGGFTGGPSVPLFARWVSIGSFTPFFRVHTAINTRDSEPWSYGEEVEEIVRNYIQLRYNLLPYYYSAFYEASRTGMPVARTLAIDYTHDPKIYDGRYHNQFLAGHGILVCPSESYKELTRVYLPQHSFWYDFYEGKKYTGGQEIIAESPLNRLPLFIKGSAIIPMQSPVQHTAEKPSDTLDVHIYYGKEANAFVYYEDDGESFDHEKGSFFKRSIAYNPNSKEIQFSAVEGSFPSKFRFIRVILHDFEQAGDAVSVDANRLSLSKIDVAFMRPISKFDPIGNANPVVLAGNNNKAFVIENSKNAVTIKW